MEQIFKELKKLGYKHYTEYTVEELDALELNNSHRIMEQALVLKWFREKYALDSYIRPNVVIDVPKTYQFNIDDNTDDIWYGTYEEAELACLIKLISIVKEKL
jgi:hypothetical protein